MMEIQPKAGHRTTKLEVKTARGLEAELEAWAKPDIRTQARAKVVAGS